MPSYKDKEKGTWYASFYVKDWQGQNKKILKRGFATKREADAYIRDTQAKTSSSLDMPFERFVELYKDDCKPRIKLNTYLTKCTIIDLKILPYFKKKRMNQITPSDVRLWQNEMLNELSRIGKPYKPTYLRTVHNQLSAIFNYAVRYYGLSENPAKVAGNMGREEHKEMLFWTKEEYLKFSKAAMKKDGIFHAFEVLYWTGIRTGEMLALTPGDFDFEHNVLSITKSLQRIKGQNVITEPKTKNSIRKIPIPNFLSEEIQDYIKRNYKMDKDELLFPFTKSGLHHEMDRCCKESGVKRIRIHDIRHSHVSMLINMGYSAIAIAKRVGHESIEITYRYAHLFPAVGQEIADSLDNERRDIFNV